MPAAKADYYDVLGVSRDADLEELRDAFHAALRAPDPNLMDDLGAEAFFRELAEAYSVLSRPASRLLYDRYGYRGRGNTGLDEALWDTRESGGGRGESIHVGLALRPKEALEGGSRVVRYDAAHACYACDGRGITGHVDPDCPSCGGTGRRSRVSDHDLRVEPCPMCGGEVCASCAGSGREAGQRALRVLWPAGIEGGTLLRVDAEGAAGERRGVPGDLLLDVSVVEARGSRFVRYAALALCLAAIALLVAYIFFQ